MVLQVSDGRDYHLFKSFLEHAANHVIIAIRPLPSASFLSVLSQLASGRSREIQTEHII